MKNKLKIEKGSGGVSHVIEYLSSKPRAIQSSIPQKTNKEINKKKSFHSL
jgi:hypothetical protein